MSDELPSISPQMRAFLEKSFQPYPGRWFYHLDRHAEDIEGQLVSRGLVERSEIIDPRTNKILVRYRAPLEPGQPEPLDLSGNGSPS
jgi:hypothetical protein